MNKLIQVNIGGLVFQIDEGAYHKLDKYLSSIRNRYAQEEGGEDILHDIEARIAELFIERTGTNGAVMMADVDHVIEQMGRPDDFETADEPISAEGPGRKRSRRFFRDGEHRQLGGVCAGFGAYFDIDPLWIRLLFVAAFFFGGSGILLYIVLWVIMPEAKTSSEKLEMRGERVNVSNIERTVKGGAREIRTKANEIGDEMKQVFSEENMRRTSNSVGEFLENIVETIKPVVHFIFKIFVFLIVLACLASLVAIAVVFLTDVGEPAAHIDFLTSHFFETLRQGQILIFGGIALAAIPLLSLLVRGVKFLLNVRLNFKAFDWTMLVLWLVCLTGVTVVGIQLAQDFEYDGKQTNRISVVQPVAGPLILQVDDSEKDAIRSEWSKGSHWKHVEVYDEASIYDDIDITIERSDDTLYSFTLIRSAHGDSRDEARSRASQVSYELGQIDSIIRIPSVVKLKEGELWRGQQVDLIVRVPMDKTIILDSRIDDFLRYNDYTEDLDHDQLFNRKLRMTATGLRPVYE